MECPVCKKKLVKTAFKRHWRLYHPDVFIPRVVINDAVSLRRTNLQIQPPQSQSSPVVLDLVGGST
jgi:hypothetical protein